MWIVELGLTDTSERLAARPAHRVLLTDLAAQGIVRMAGPLADDTGAIAIFDVADRAALDELMAADPYFTTHGVTVVSIRQWSPFLA